MPPPPEVPAFEVEELTGSQRSIRLRDRALPYQGVGFPITQRTKKTYYGGNPVATLQVLGPDYGNTQLDGIWKARFLADSVEFNSGNSGSAAAPDLSSPEDLVLLFEDIALSGNTLRVQWGPHVREGILVRFTPDWIRLQDVKWAMEFEWSSAGQRAPTAAPATASDDEMRATSAANDDAAVRDPSNVNAEYRQSVAANTNASRVTLGQVFSRLVQARRLAQMSSTIAQGIASSAETLRTQVQSGGGLLLDLPYTVAQPDDGVLSVLACEGWRRTLARTSAAMLDAVLRRALAAARQAVPNAIAVIVMPGGATLRTLAIAYYGNADAWQLIADANGFPGAIVAAGTLVIIPAPAPVSGR